MSRKGTTDYTDYTDEENSDYIVDAVVVDGISC